MKVLIIGAGSGKSRFSEMVAEMCKEHGVEVEHQSEATRRMIGHRPTMVFMDELGSGKTPLVEMDYAELEKRVMANLGSDSWWLTNSGQMPYMQVGQALKPKPNKGPRDRWSKLV